MAWQVVHFISADDPVETVEAVPACYLIENKTKCYWPPYTGPKLRSSIGKCEIPMPDVWEIYKVRLIGKSYDNLAKARLKALKAEATSDINSDVELLIKRDRKKNRRFVEESEEDTQEIDDPSESEIEEEIAMPSLQSPEQQCSQGLLSTVSQYQEVVTSTPNITPTSRVLGISDHHLSSNANHDLHNLSVEAFKRYMVRQMHVINLNLDGLCEDVPYLLRKTNMNQDEPSLSNDSIIAKFSFPLKTEADLNQVEKCVANREMSLQFETELARIGGRTSKIMAKRIMTKIFSNQLAMEYSWIGFKSKKKFSILNIANIVLDAVQNIHKNTTTADIEAAIKMWLVKAKEREKKAIGNDPNII